MTINYRSSIIQVSPVAPAAASSADAFIGPSPQIEWRPCLNFSYTYARTLCKVMLTLHVKNLPQHESPQQRVKFCQSISYYYLIHALLTT
eukprot:scaffold425832_cov21-Prasinocladus_malaysianus.AAC.1